MLLVRLLLTRELEMFELKESLYEDTRFYLLLIDTKRESTINDFSYLNLSSEEFVSRANFIKAIIIYNNEISNEEREITYEIASGFLENKDDCHWNLSYINGNFEELRPIGVNPKELVKQVNDILLSNGLDKQIGNIETEKFNYLCQD